MKNKVVLTLSGGCDSTVLLYKAVEEFDEIFALSFDYNQRHKEELQCAEWHINDLQRRYHKVKIHHKVIDVKYIRDIAPTSSLTNNNIATPDVHTIRGEAQPASYVPFRNLMFLSIAASYAEANKCNTIWYGSAQADSLAGYWDSSIEFLESINSTIALNRENKITIEAPLINMSKKAIIELGVALCVNFSRTITCYSGDQLADANSASSSLRLQGFIQAGYMDPILYKQQDKLSEIYLQNNCKRIKYAEYQY